LCPIVSIKESMNGNGITAVSSHDADRQKGPIVKRVEHGTMGGGSKR
jgi:hypothetical protein